VRDVDQGGPGDARHRLQPRDFTRGSHDLRFAALEPYVRGRSVLDLGCGSGYRRADWMHAQIAAVAGEVVGVEVDAATVAAMRSKGFVVEHADAESLDLGRTFDVVFAGELIEHLSNFAGFLATAHRHLGANGRLVLTTPNVFSLANIVYRMTPGTVRTNRDHTCWFCADTISTLLRRHGFEPDISYIRHETPGRARSIATGLIRAPLPDRVAWNTILVVARPV